MTVTLNQPWLEFDLGQVMQVLSWAPHGAGCHRARRILWRQVRNADLPADLDVAKWLDAQMHRRGAGAEVCMLTSRDISVYHVARKNIESHDVLAVATVGLSNAERVGHRVNRTGRDWNRDLSSAQEAGFGTINIALRLSTPLSQIGLLEAMSIATQARTLAVLDAAHVLPDGAGLATGTGTDCIAVAAPEGSQHYAGLHTALGEAIGQAVLQAVSEGARVWQRSIGLRSEG